MADKKLKEFIVGSSYHSYMTRQKTFFMMRQVNLSWQELIQRGMAWSSIEWQKQRDKLDGVKRDINAEGLLSERLKRIAIGEMALILRQYANEMHELDRELEDELAEIGEW